MKIPSEHSPRIVARVEQDAKTGAMRGKLHLFDQVGGYEGIYAKDVAAKLDSLKDEGARDLDVHIHSPGGDLFEGVAIHSAITAWDKGEKHVHVDGLAASIASLIAMAGDKVTIGPHAMMMLHNAKPFMFGAFDSPSLRKIADRVDQQQGVLAKCYAEASGKSEAEVLKMMAKETWLTAEDAVKHGFADAIEGREEEGSEDGGEDESEEARFRAVASALFSSVPPQAARLFAFSPLPHNPPAQPAHPQESDVTFDELKTKLTEATLAASTMQARAETSEKITAELLAATGKPSAGEALAMVAGLKEQAAQASVLTEKLAKFEAEKKTAEIKALFDVACKDGRLTPARRADLEKPEAPAFTRDPAQLKAFIDCLQPIAAVTTEAKAAAVAPAGEPVVTPEITKVAEQCGLDPKVVAQRSASVLKR